MKYLLICILSFHSIYSSSQKLSTSRRSSQYTYIYKINENETWKLARSSMSNVSEKYLYNLTDSFLSDKNKLPNLPHGNFLLVKARGNRLYYELYTPYPIRFKQLNNEHDFAFILHQDDGTLISNVKVYIGSRQIDYNKDSKCFLGKRFKGNVLVRVYYKEAIHLFEAKPQGIFKPGIWKTIISSFPVKNIIYQIKKRREFRNFFHSTSHEKNYRGFIVFNKPIYKPGDTIFLKAFVTNRRGDPYNSKLLLRISSRYLDCDSMIAVLEPYRKGNYIHSFVLSDSLNLELDEDYLITLEKTSSSKYNLTNYSGDLDDEEYASKRKVVVRGKFKYEEYELQDLNISARTSGATNSPGEEMMLFIKATDENELAVMDASAVITIRPSEYPSPVFSDSEVFIPDTLWHVVQPLDPIGETRIIIPDSIFPKASFNYRINCEIRTSNNQKREKELKAFYNSNIDVLTIRAENDSILLMFKKAGKPLQVDAVLKGLNSTNDTISSRNIQLPSTIGVDPFIYRYVLEYADKSVTHEVKDGSPVYCSYERTRDSIKIKVENKLAHPVWYTLFAGNRSIKKGASPQWIYKAKTTTDKHYSLVLEYMNGDKICSKTYYIPYYKNNLQLISDQTPVVYPGQKTMIQIQVNDAEGRPVKGADLTAYAFTKKFTDYSGPEVPYLGRNFKLRKNSPKYQANEWNENTILSKLNWVRWSKEMKLDTIAYYQFLHPVSLYINTEVPMDSVTQLAPFVVLKGELQPVHQLYIDGVPFYFSQSGHLSNYSFPVAPGKHSFKLRTHNKMIILDSFWVSKGVKNIVSINADTSNKRIKVINLPDTLTAYEKLLWNRYMIMVENNFNQRMAYIKQRDMIYYLNPPGTTGTVLTGPLINNNAEINVKNSFNRYFEVEGGYSYLFSEGLTRQKQVAAYPYFKQLPSFMSEPDFSDFVLSEAELNQRWQNYLDIRSSGSDLFNNGYTGKTGNGKLLIEIANDELFVKNIFVFKSNAPSFLKIYRGSAKDLGFYEPAQYRILFLLKDNKYFIKEGVAIKKDGINYYSVLPAHIKNADSMSQRMWGIIEAIEYSKSTENSYESDQLRMTFNDKYLDYSGFKQKINGRITDPSGYAIAFASVKLVGTNYGTNTDANGNFILSVPAEGSLIISAVGYESVSLSLSAMTNYNISMAVRESHMEEVVVTALGYKKARSLAYSSVSVSLSGRAPGLMIPASPGSSVTIRVRGISTSVDNRMLVLIDGIPSTIEKFNLLDTALIQQIELIDGEKAVAVFGKSAAGGVLNITTRSNPARSKENESTDDQHTIRRRFRDHAYWKPDLITDEEGKAKFEVEFPDDITNWRTYAIATTSKKQTGWIEGSIKSFKAISANLGIPQFAIEGDSVRVIAKAMNYLTDSVHLAREFFLNDTLIQSEVIGLKYSHIDSFNIVAADKDSLKFLYTIKKEGGYFDGEERSLPVYPQGVLETKGFFAALHNDTSFVLKTDTGMVKVYADASLIPVWEDEITKIRNYEYLCNEQLASKLKAILVQKRIDSKLKRPFKWEKYTLDLIRQLEKNKAASGLWGWWNNTKPTLWITLHVMEALVQAQDMGYKISLDKNMLSDYLIYDIESFQRNTTIWNIALLDQLNSKVDFKKYIDSIEKYNAGWSLLDKLRLAEIKQKRNLPYSLDTLLNRYKQTMFGNLYWGEENNNFFDNSIQVSLSMYRLLKAEGGHEVQLQKLRNYFLEKRSRGSWKNTYESSLVLETILPDILEGDSLPSNPKLIIDSMVITQLPFSKTFSGNSTILVNKEGRLPVYFTAYEQQWNVNPQKISTDFEVRTSFEHNGQGMESLKAGESSDLVVKVTVKKDAEYVMVEIPIPAGCSYRDKLQSNLNNEVHREYFRHKVSLFCSFLKTGNYEFRVSLLPRYAGTYHLNPARVEMMYFPVFYGRETGKLVKIR